MSQYRRLYVPGGTYFFTVVTHERRQFLCDDSSRSLLREAINAISKSLPFETVAIVLLPDHLHAIWTLPPGDDDFSTRWRQIKDRFTRNYLKLGGTEGERSDSRIKQKERAIWQRRFWEHLCDDEDDLKRHLDYVHWNPMKHGLVKRVVDYKWSSFHRYMKLGEYTSNWGETDPCPGYAKPEWE